MKSFASENVAICFAPVLFVTKKCPEFATVTVCDSAVVEKINSCAPSLPVPNAPAVGSARVTAPAPYVITVVPGKVAAPVAPLIT